MTSSRRLLPMFGALFAVLAMVLSSVDGLRAQASSADVLATLRQGHPRLYVTDAELARIKAELRHDSEVKGWYDQLQAQARKMLSEPTVEHKLIGPRMLAQSRAALERISTLAFLYRLDGDRQKAERARAEMLAAAAFPDWNPSHFLDTAEMTHALAVGYDWLYSYLSPEDRATIRKAIGEKGLKQGLQAFKGKAWWTEANHNWNQVCNGGLTLGALAVADEQPDMAREMIDLSRGSIVLALRSFAPDGGWIEGPGYWNYATQYTTYYLAALESALGTDFGFAQMPGLSDTGLFRIYSVGPLGLTFNYADAEANAGTAAQMFWLARAFQRPLYAQHERRLAVEQPHIFHLIWSSGSGAASPAPNPPLDARFRAIHVAFFRSAWDDPDAVYVGFKGGDNAANHSHLDLGTFVLDALGERWALDLGPDDYDLPGYFGKLRYTYYRLRTEGHNTLTMDGGNQDSQATAPLVAFFSTPERAFAVADLTAAYAPKVKQARRGVALLNRRQVLVQDEVEASVGRRMDVAWNFHTRASVAVAGPRATLTQGKVQLEARILSPEGARFEVISANPPPPQAQQPEVHNLVVRIRRMTGPVRIMVLLAPSLPAAAGGEVKEPSIEPLQAWIDAAKE